MPGFPAPRLSGRVGYPLGFTAATVTTLAAVAAGATTRPWPALAALCGVATVAAAVTTLPAAAIRAVHGLPGGTSVRLPVRAWWSDEALE